MWFLLMLFLRPVRRLFIRASRALFVVVFTTVVVAFGAGLWMMRNDPAVTTASSAPRPPTAAADARVVRVVDGDTIVVTDGATRATVRLLGIDTPEVKDRRTAVQLCGPQASARTAALLPPGTRVLIESDATQDQSDRYGRALAYVWRAARSWSTTHSSRRVWPAATCLTPPDPADTPTSSPLPKLTPATTSAESGARNAAGDTTTAPPPGWV